MLRLLRMLLNAENTYSYPKGMRNSQFGIVKKKEKKIKHAKDLQSANENLA